MEQLKETNASMEYYRKAIYYTQPDRLGRCIWMNSIHFERAQNSHVEFCSFFP